MWCPNCYNNPENYQNVIDRQVMMDEHEELFRCRKCGYEMVKNEGRKHDNGKLRYELIPPEFEQALAEVYTFGANKYADRNWEKGLMYSQLVGAIKRHLAAYEMGEMNDEESACHHLAALCFSAAALITFDRRKMSERLNDLPHWRSQEEKNVQQFYDALNQRGEYVRLQGGE